MATPEEKIAAIAPNWKYHRPGIFTDPIWMEYAIEQNEPELRNQLAAVRLQTVAAVLRSISEGAANAAKVFAKQGGK